MPRFNNKFLLRDLDAPNGIHLEDPRVGAVDRIAILKNEDAEDSWFASPLHPP